MFTTAGGNPRSPALSHNPGLIMHWTPNQGVQVQALAITLGSRTVDTEQALLLMLKECDTAILTVS